ncbi:MAG: hemolysin III family protein [Trueperaceae bacterium]|nr:hemolysin III family protein [Trueperaceae bacterium]
MDLSRYDPGTHAQPSAPRPVHRWPSWWWRRLEVSANTHRSFSHTAPRMRGWSHMAMVFVWPVLVVLLLRRADTTTALAGALAFGLGMQAMFTLSALTHLRRWDVWTTEAMFRLDHTGIFLAIAGSITPFALLALDGWLSTVVLVGVWAATLGGIGFALWPTFTPVGFGNTVFITLGALTTPLLPWAWDRMGPVGVALLLGGGAIYIAGALMLAHQWPQGRPRVFGYHEVWHAMVVLAALVHYAMVRSHLLPLA